MVVPPISRDGPFSRSSHSDEDDFSLPLSEDEEMEDEESSLVSIDEEDKSSGSAMFSELLQASKNSPTNRQGESPKSTRPPPQMQSLGAP